MAAINLNVFRGSAPRIAPKLLNQTQAASNTMARFENGQLTAWRGNETIQAVAKSGTMKSLYLYRRQFWFHFPYDVDVVRGPVANDTRERVYWTHEPAASIEPRMSVAAIATGGVSGEYPTAWYKLGIPAPTVAPTASTTPTGDPEDWRTTAYVYTYVSEYGEEGPPSPPSTVIDRFDGDTVNLSNLAVAPAGNYNITRKWVYRAITGVNGTDYQFVKEVPIATTTTTDTVTDENLGEPLPSRGWFPPPATLQGLVSMPNGIIAGFSGQDIYFCEPYLPHAWPEQYRLTTDYPIVGLGVFGNTLVVLTEAHPYLVSGVTPASMTMRELEQPLACISKRSITSNNFRGVVYASPDGLVLVNGGGPQLISGGAKSKRDWEALNPTTLHGYMHDGRYFGFYNDGTAKGFMFDLRDTESGWTDLNFHATAAFNDEYTDSLYMVIGSNIVKWDSPNGTAPRYTWQSKVFALPQYHNFGVAQVVAGSYSAGGNAINFKLYADGVLREDVTVTSRDPFRLAGGYRGRDWQIEISGIDNIQEVNLATVPQELGTGG